ncbi:hypothetical protein [Microbacterium ureisolvens]|uniref:Fibronectin type-III domain-containing protein n=1 Tax=Microbacterium ureisolvens TaxID=2781186 RepID=A0ABS7I1J1_9MICO|nr:hypothetical protein [Microbacterium ureisolvens]MBW9110686.1 hypothetical protein [Microbacterium ureisolvens]
MIRRLLGPIAAIVTLAVLGGAGGATAAWMASASMAASVSSATVATTAQLTGGLTTTYRADTSAPATGQLTIANTGGAPLSYTLATQLGAGSSAALAEKIALRLWTGSGCGTTAPSTAENTTLANAAPALPTAARTLAPGASVVVCVATQLDAQSASPLAGQAVTATFAVTGLVGTSWTTTATTAAFTQSVHGLAAAGAPACVQAPPHGVQLSWAAPTNRSAGATLQYRLVDKANVVVKELSSSAATLSVVLGGTDITADGVHELRIVATEKTAAGTVSSDSPTLLVRRTAVGNSNIKYECVMP